MSKKHKTYTAEELCQIKARLIDHRERLPIHIQLRLDECITSGSLDIAAALRDQAQYLTATYNALNTIDMFITAAERGEPQCVPFRFEDLGLESEA